MKVLHLDSGKEMRGGQWQVLRLVEGLTATGVEATLLARDGSPLWKAAVRAGMRVDAIGLGRVAMAARRCDLVHAHDARAHTLAALVPGAPLVVSRRVAFPIHSRWKYGRARRYVAVSEFVKSVLAAGGVPEERICVVYDGVPLLGPSRGGCILAPESTDPRKGSALAREAAGMAGVELQFSSDLAGDLAQAEMLVYATYSEGLGSGVLLAMSAAVPVIASKVGGLTEIIRHRENGLLVENDARPMAEAIRELHQDAALARRLGAAGRETVKERFTVNRMVQRTMEVYRQVLS
jgi:hypothetical protein